MGRPRMDADVADACDLLRGAGFFVSFFFAVTIKILLAMMPVLQERGNVSNEGKCATQILRNFRMGSNSAFPAPQAR